MNVNNVRQLWVGRKSLIDRFVARFSHYRFFIYEGISGSGKTALLHVLAERAKSLGLQQSVLLSVYPGEGVLSLLLRLEKRLFGKNARVIPSDPYARLHDILDSQSLVLLLDNLHHLRSEQLLQLVRMIAQSPRGNFCVLASSRQDLPLGAPWLAKLHFERLTGLDVEDAEALAKHLGLGDKALAIVRGDVARRGALAHPLTLCCMSMISSGQLPDLNRLKMFVARSLAALQTIFAQLVIYVPQSVRQKVGLLGQIGLPMDYQRLYRLWGAELATGVRLRLVSLVDEQLVVPQLAYQALLPKICVEEYHDVEVAKLLIEHAETAAEPLALVAAARLYSRAGNTALAIDLLNKSLDYPTDPGFAESFLKALALLPKDDTFASRVHLLNLQARVKSGHGEAALVQLGKLGDSVDSWTQATSLCILCSVAFDTRDYPKVLTAWQKLSKLQQNDQQQWSAELRSLWIKAGICALRAALASDHLRAGEGIAEQLLAASQQFAFHDEALAADIAIVLAQIYTGMGRLSDAIAQTETAIAHYQTNQDAILLANAYAQLGDLCREAGEIQKAAIAYREFLQSASSAKERNLMLIAQLSEARLSLEVGDVMRAGKKIAAVEQQIGASASSRLKRILQSTLALLEAGRGQHAKATKLLAKVVPLWQSAGETMLARGFNVALIRSLVSCNKLEQAQAVIDKALVGLQPDEHGPQVAMLLREAALIGLRRNQLEQANAQLAQACSLFEQSDNKTQQAQTLYRFAEAALCEGHMAEAAAKAEQAYGLAQAIANPRLQALILQLQASLALYHNRSNEAVAYAKQAESRLRNLGDALSAAYSMETLIRALLFAGDLQQVLVLGRKLAEQSKTLGALELRIRGICLVGIALLRQEKFAKAMRCFRRFKVNEVSAWTRALMARFGEALMLSRQDTQLATSCRSQWVYALKQLPVQQRLLCINMLAQLALAPRDRCELREGNVKRILGTEQMALLQPKAFDLWVDVLYRRVLVKGKVHRLPAAWSKLFLQLCAQAPERLAWDMVWRTLEMEPKAYTPATGRSFAAGADKAIGLKTLVTFHVTAAGVALKISAASSAFLVPVWLAGPLSDEQKDILRLLRRLGMARLHRLESACAQPQGHLQKNLGQLKKNKLIERVVSGRGRVYRLV